MRVSLYHDSDVTSGTHVQPRLLIPNAMVRPTIHDHTVAEKTKKIRMLNTMVYTKYTVRLNPPQT